MKVQSAEVLANAMQQHPPRDDGCDTVEVHASGTRQVGYRDGHSPSDFAFGGLMHVMVGAAAWPIGPSGVALMVAAEEFASRIVGAPGGDEPAMFESAGWDVTVPR